MLVNDAVSTTGSVALGTNVFRHAAIWLNLIQLSASSQLKVSVNPEPS